MAAFVNSSTQTSSLDEVDYDEEECELLDNVKSSPRVVIDTSPPFASVEEAVLRFGGRGCWIPRPFAPAHSPPHQLHDPNNPDTYKLEDRTTEMLNDLQSKEQETLEILKEHEFTKRLVKELKMKLPKQAPESIQLPYDKEHTVNDQMGFSQSMKLEQINSFPTSTGELIMTELKQTKLHLYRNTSDLAAIRASVESLGKKIEREKELIERAREVKITTGGLVNPSLISKELRELNHEAEQFMKTAELARSEVLKAMTDVELTQTGLKVIEMRWVAAKKLEEAARAAESLALAQIRALSSNDDVFPEIYQENHGRISLSLEEYSALSDKARKAENLFERKDVNDGFMKVEEETEEKLSKKSLEVMNRRKVSAHEALGRFGSNPNSRKSLGSTHYEFRNTLQTRPRRDPRLLEPREFEFMKNEIKPVLRPTSSTGNILSRKLVLKDDIYVGRQREDSRCERQRVSLNQMLSQHRGEISPLNRSKKDGGGNKYKLFSKRKAFRFVHISLPLTKPSKSKIQALNLW